MIFRLKFKLLKQHTNPSISIYLLSMLYTKLLRKPQVYIVYIFTKYYTVPSAWNALPSDFQATSYSFNKIQESPRHWSFPWQLLHIDQRCLLLAPDIPIALFGISAHVTLYFNLLNTAALFCKYLFVFLYLLHYVSKFSRKLQQQTTLVTSQSKITGSNSVLSYPTHHWPLPHQRSLCIIPAAPLKHTPVSLPCFHTSINIYTKHG